MELIKLVKTYRLTPALDQRMSELERQANRAEWGGGGFPALRAR